MSESAQFVLLAEYNEWMNAKLYAAAAQLAPADLVADRGAFFGSLAGTLNHIVAADTIWLRRFAAHPARPAVLQALLAAPATTLGTVHSLDAAVLWAYRQQLDALIREWAAGLSDDDLGYVLAYRNIKGEGFQRRYGSLVLHFFNHQTHHRGQASTLLSQAGIDVGVTDLVMLVPHEGPA